MHYGEHNDINIWLGETEEQMLKWDWWKDVQNNTYLQVDFQQGKTINPI